MKSNRKQLETLISDPVFLNKLPKRLFVRWALTCCKRLNLSNPRQIEALNLVQRWCDVDESITEDDLAAAQKNLNIGDHDERQSSYAIMQLVFATRLEVEYLRYINSCIHFVLKIRPVSKHKDWTKEILLSMIDEDLSLIEKAMIYG